MQIIIFILLSLSVIGNLAFLDFVAYRDFQRKGETQVSGTIVNGKIAVLSAKVDDLASNLVKVVTKEGEKVIVQTPVSNICPVACTKTIEEAIANAKISSGSQTTTTITSNSAPASTPTPSPIHLPKEYYIPLGSGQTSQLNQWVTLNSAQADFNISNFPKIKQAYFEVILHTTEGEVKARLYDTGTPNIYAGNEARSQSFDGELVSVPINLISGQKKYKVQLYTTIGVGYLDFARIKIVTN